MLILLDVCMLFLYVVLRIDKFAFFDNICNLNYVHLLRIFHFEKKR